MSTTLSLAWLAALAKLALGSATVFACAGVARSARLRAGLAGYCAAIELDLRCLQLRLHARRVLGLQLALLAAVPCACVTFATPLPLALGLLALFGPRRVLRAMRRRRAKLIESQLDGFLLALANQLRANPALGEAIRASARLVPRPMSEEMLLVHKETRLGMPLDRALSEMAARVQSPLCSAAIATLRVARNTGGDLSRTLEASAASLREMARLEGVVRSKTAEGRAQSLMIGVLPAPLVLLLRAIDRQLFEPLVAKPLGHVVLAIACALWLCALVWANRIVAVDV